MKSYTDIEQSKKLAEILPIESADMTLPFRHPKNDEYIPGYVVSRNYVEVHNEMMKLPAMEKEDVCKLIQPSWSLTALLSFIPNYKLSSEHNHHTCTAETSFGKETVAWFDNPVDACYEMILKLKEKNLL